MSLSCDTMHTPLDQDTRGIGYFVQRINAVKTALP